MSYKNILLFVPCIKYVLHTFAETLFAVNVACASLLGRLLAANQLVEIILDVL